VLTRLANQPRQHADQPVRDARDPVRVRLLRGPAERCDLDGRRGFDRLAACDRERASLVRPGDPSRPLGAVEASALRRPHRLVAKVNIAHPGLAHSEQELLRDAKRVQLVMRK